MKIEDLCSAVIAAGFLVFTGGLGMTAGGDTITPAGVGSTMGQFDAPVIGRETKLASKANFRWVRVRLPYEHQAPEAYEFQKADRIVDAAEEAGLQVLGIIEGTPQWLSSRKSAQDEQVFSRSKPDNLLETFRFAKALGKHYRGRIRYWEIWDEPNDPASWRDTTADYCDYLKAVSLGLKAGDPENRVVGCATSGVDLAFIRRVMELGGAPYMDAVSIHPYIGDAAPDAANLGQFIRDARVLVDRFDPGKPIWITEFGYDTGDRLESITTAQQADYLADFYRVAWRQGIQNAFVHVLRDSTEAQYGLVDTTFSPKPAYETLRQLLAGDIEPVPVPASVDPSGNLMLIPETYRPTYTITQPFTLTAWVYNFSADAVDIELEIDMPDGVHTEGRPPDRLAVDPGARSKVELDLRTALSEFVLTLADSEKRFAAQPVTVRAKPPLEVSPATRFARKAVYTDVTLHNSLDFRFVYPLRCKGDRKTILYKKLMLDEDEQVTLTFENIFNEGVLFYQFGPQRYEEKLRPDLPVIYRHRVRVDGWYDEWRRIPSRLNLYRDEQVAVKPAAWQGIDDLSASFAFAYDDDTIYLYVDVLDDMPRYNERTVRFWDGDAVEVLLDTDLSDKENPRFSDDDFHFYFMLTARGRSSSYCLNTGVKGRDLDGIRIDGGRAGGGYRMEIAISRDLLGMTGLYDDRFIGLNVAVNDADELPTRENQIVWHGKKEVARDTTRMGKVRFSKPETRR